jgi:hypothetical protein
MGKRFRRLAGLLWVLFALLLIGCAKVGEAGAPAAPESAAAKEESDEAFGGADNDADGIADESPPPAPPPAPGALYNAGVRYKSAPAPTRAGAVAQAAAPAVGTPGAADKRAERADAPGTPPADGSSGVADKAAIASPMLIYTARLHLAVFETRKAMDAAEKLARDSGGYLVRRNDRTITFRVPAGKFQGTLADVLKLGDLLHREVTARDVTEEFFDTQVRLQNLEAVRARFEELLKRAQKVEEALAVERELERVAGQIEQLKGRLKLLKELVAFSTITVEFQPRAVDQVESVVRLPFPWLRQLGLGELLRL